MFEQSIYENYELDFKKDYETDEKSYYLIFNNNRNLYLTPDKCIPLLTSEDAGNFDFNFKFYIGRYKNKPCFVANVDEGDDFYFLGDVYKINPETYQIGGRAALVCDWYILNQYCGKCGSKTQLQNRHMTLKCPKCGRSIHASIYPAIIVAIHKDDKLLMARHSYDTRVEYALIAGFVEPGESIEDAVHREVMEEVGLKIKNLEYMGSQSWPFPNSLMCAYKAEYDSGDIKVDHDEILKAKWFSKDEVKYSDSDISIYSLLLDDFKGKKSSGGK